MERELDNRIKTIIVTVIILGLIVAGVILKIVEKNEEPVVYESETQEDVMEEVAIENDNQTDEYVEEIVDDGLIHLTANEASELDGLYVFVSEDDFIQLSPIENALADSGSDKTHGLWIYSDVKNPIVGTDAQIALFSSESVNNVYAFPVLKEGYTVPLEFCDDGDVYYFFCGDTNYVREPLQSQYSIYRNMSSGPSHFWANVEELNGEDYATFYEDHLLDLNYTPDRQCCYDWIYSTDSGIFDLEKDEILRIGWFEGTQFTEIDAQACLHYYIIDGCERTDYSASITGEDYWLAEDIPFELTKNGYALCDISGLESGTYIITYRAGYTVMQYHYTVLVVE